MIRYLIIILIAGLITHWLFGCGAERKVEVSWEPAEYNLGGEYIGPVIDHLVYVDDESMAVSGTSTVIDMLPGDYEISVSSVVFGVEGPKSEPVFLSVY